jgi:hypothetical protein
MFLPIQVREPAPNCAEAGVSEMTLVQEQVDTHSEEVPF